jgi:hypothetical protein
MSTRRPALALTLAALAVLGACGQRLAFRVTRTASPLATTAAEVPVPRGVADPDDLALEPVSNEARIADGFPDPERLWGLVIGIDDYPGTRNDLDTAVLDARTMERALGQLGFPPGHVRVLTEAEATAAAILEGAAWLAARVGPGHTGVFLFAGHALQRSGDPDGDGEDVDEALVSSGFDYVYDAALARALTPARGALWLVFANCNAGGFDDAAARGRVLTFASGENELAYENAGLGGSYLVRFVVAEAILEDGASTAEEAFRRGRGSMIGRVERFRPLQMDLHRGPLTISARPPRAAL